jgi:CrcB protein
MNVLLVALGGAAGSVARYLLTGLVHRVSGPFFPYGTFAVNVFGSALFGWLAARALEGGAVSAQTRLFLLVGVLGGFTTFSTFSFETFELLKSGAWVRALGNATGQVLLGLIGLALGYAAGRP